MILSFRPLAGIMVLIKPNLATYSFFLPSFPSPCGDYGSYLIYFDGVAAIEEDRFPSPCGDYGSYQKMGYKAVSLHDEQFPSPCGDYGSYHADE